GLFAEYFDVAIYDGCERVDALLAMGSDSTAAALRQKYADIPKLLRASRSSVAVLSGGETAEELDALCRDITMYDGRGCRNVSQLLVSEGYDISPLAEAMARTEVSVRWMNVYRHQRALLGMSGAEFVDGRKVVILRSEEAPMNLATLHYSTEDAASWLAVHDSKIQCVVGSISHPRAVPFGRSQYPTLTDYPDGVDTMNFLQSI
ncbi:MAG: aldehyde dehydrogenase, partial [Rikenellaceae bacterium]|nr:aldehyde dehydrogenase [Rikenellaceae bacterium]